MFRRNQSLSIDIKIYVTHNGYQRQYRVNGLRKNGASTETFPFKRAGNEIKITVQNYFEEELNVSLRYDYVHFYFEKFYFF